MSIDIQYFSFFLYGYDVTSLTNKFDFDEGGGELTATVPVGSYTPGDLATELQTALNDVGGFTYTVSFSRSTRKFTISAASAFSVLIDTGTSAAPIYSILGFTGSSDLASATSQVSDSKSGSAYRPQFKLQDYISTDHWQQLIQPSINKTSSGRVEVIRFGTEKFMQCSIKFITNNSFISDGRLIRHNSSGVDAFESFIQHCIQKKPVEFIPDENTVSTWQKLILESTEESSDGVGYKMKELYSINIPGVFESGILKFRLQE